MRTIYNSYNACMDDKVQDEARILVRDYFDRLVPIGYNPREIAHYLIGAVMTEEAEIVLKNAMDMRRKEREDACRTQSS